MILKMSITQGNFLWGKKSNTGFRHGPYSCPASLVGLKALQKVTLDDSMDLQVLLQ